MHDTNTILIEDGEAWVRYTRTPEGAVVVDSYLEPRMDGEQTQALVAWLSWHALDMPRDLGPAHA